MNSHLSASRRSGLAGGFKLILPGLLLCLGILACSLESVFPAPTPKPTHSISILTKLALTPDQSAAANQMVIVEVKEQVQVQTQSGAWLSTVTPGTLLQVGDTLLTNATGQAVLQLADGALVRVSSESIFTVKAFDNSKPDDLWMRLNLALGDVVIDLTGTAPKGDYEVETPMGVAAVRGSLIGVIYRPELGAMIVECLETRLVCTYTKPDGTELVLKSGQRAVLITGNPEPIVEDMSYADIQRYVTQLPPAEQTQIAPVLAVIYPDGTPTPGPTRTPLPCVPNTIGVICPAP